MDQHLARIGPESGPEAPSCTGTEPKPFASLGGMRYTLLAWHTPLGTGLVWVQGLLFGAPPDQPLYFGVEVNTLTRNWGGKGY